MVVVLDTDESELLKQCGSSTPEEVVSSGSKMTVQFRSDGSIARRGFRASWTRLADSGKDDDSGDEVLGSGHGEDDESLRSLVIEEYQL